MPVSEVCKAADLHLPMHFLYDSNVSSISTRPHFLDSLPGAMEGGWVVEGEIRNGSQVITMRTFRAAVGALRMHHIVFN